MKLFRRCIAIITCCMMILGLLVGCANNPETESVAETVMEPEVTLAPVVIEPDEELLRAISVDMIPQEWSTQLADSITFKEYADVLTHVVELWDSQKVPEWQKITAMAAASEEDMKREDGLLMLSYLWILMGKGEVFPESLIDEGANPDSLFTPEMQEAQMRELSWEYPYFPDWETEAYKMSHCNYMWGSVGIFPIMISPVSGEPVIEWNEKNSLRLQDALTYEDAAHMAIRFADYCKIEPDESWRNYISVSEVGTYNQEIITDALLGASSDLPEVTQSILPSEWKGSGIGARKHFIEEYLHYEESDIAFLSENGFNFLRLFFDFQTLRYPDYPDDAYVVNQKELEELDQLLAWCIEYDVHLQIAMQNYMSENGYIMKSDSRQMPMSEEDWALTKAYWTMLAERYAGISSKYLSFDLCNEIEPATNDMKNQKLKLEEVVASIREADPERVLIYSQSSKGNLAWTEAIASLGVAVGCHPYAPNFMTAGDFGYSQQNPYAKAVWPLPYFPMSNVMDGKASIQIGGDISGAKMGIHIWNSDSSPVICVSADGQMLEKITPQGVPFGPEGNYYYYDTIYYVQLPETAETVSVKVEEGTARIDTIVIEKNNIATTMMVTDILSYPDFTDPLPLIVNGDGTYTNSENRMYDAELIYKEVIEPYQKMAEKYDVGFMVNEFGMYGTKVYWDIDTVTAFHRTYLELLEEKDIPWCYCESSNVFPKHLIILYGEESQWQGATEEDITYTLKSGGEDTVRVCKELLDVFREYTLK